ELGRWDDLFTLLTDPAYLESRMILADPNERTQGSQWVELGNDLASLAANIDDSQQRRLVRLLDETLRLEERFLTRHPECLFQAFWNALWWHDAPNVDQHYEPAEGQNHLSVTKPQDATPV